MRKIVASKGMVLCDGYNKSSIGGSVYLPDNIENNWLEMTDEEANELILENNPPEVEYEEISDEEALRIITEGVI